MSHNERLLEVDGAQLCVETFGDPTRPAILLVAGGATSMDAWEPEFCARLADPGHFVVRYDHRDTGRSSSAPAGHPDYSAADLATDPLRILDRSASPAPILSGCPWAEGSSSGWPPFTPAGC
jgi:pimeloyl-ACP methyl ester carboxylesterase